MECKYTDVRGLGEAFSELIDTLWNVNEVVRIRCDLSTLELIALTVEQMKPPHRWV